MAKYRTETLVLGGIAVVVVAAVIIKRRKKPFGSGVDPPSGINLGNGGSTPWLPPLDKPKSWPPPPPSLSPADSNTWTKMMAILFPTTAAWASQYDTNYLPVLRNYNKSAWAIYSGTTVRKVDLDYMTKCALESYNALKSNNLLKPPMSSWNGDFSFEGGN